MVIKIHTSCDFYSKVIYPTNTYFMLLSDIFCQNTNHDHFITLEVVIKFFENAIQFNTSIN